MKRVQSRFDFYAFGALLVSLQSLACTSLELGGALNCTATALRKPQRSVRASPQRTEATRAAALHYAADVTQKN